MFCLETIQVFLERRKVNVEKTINKIEKHIVRDMIDALHTALQKIAETLFYLDEQSFFRKSYSWDNGVVSNLFRSI